MKLQILRVDYDDLDDHGEMKDLDQIEEMKKEVTLLNENTHNYRFYILTVVDEKEGDNNFDF